jgi:hypothetical protein
MTAAPGATPSGSWRRAGAPTKAGWTRWFGNRKLLACADYHRATTAAGWVTFEVRDADAKGLVLHACQPAFYSCERPAVVRLT